MTFTPEQQIGSPGVRPVTGAASGSRESTISRVQRTVARPTLLTLLLAVNGLAWVLGAMLWYGEVLADPATPTWSWLFIPDCPLFGMAGVLALMLISARREWTAGARYAAQRVLLAGGLVCGIIWLCVSSDLLAVPDSALASLLGLSAALFLLFGLLFTRLPNWLLTIVAFGQIKYGLWTITLWLLFWQQTARIYGAPIVTLEGVAMMLTHVGLLLQGVMLLTYFAPTITGALAGLLWFAASDVVDYVAGYHPAIPEAVVPVAAMRNSTIGVTWLLGGLLLWLAWRRRQQVAAEAGAGGTCPVG